MLSILLLFHLEFCDDPLGVAPWYWTCREWTPQSNQPWNYFRKIATYVTTKS